MIVEVTQMQEVILALYAVVKLLGQKMTCAMNVTSSGCVKHASGMRVHSVQHLHIHRGGVWPWGLCLASV